MVTAYLWYPIGYLEMALRVRKNKAVIPHACPMDEAASLLAGAWTPHVIWYLSQQPRRFGELRKDIPRISARVLSARLRELQTKGLVTCTPLATSPPSAEYRLTDLGREVVPALTTLVGAALKIRAGNARASASVASAGLAARARGT